MQRRHLLIGAVAVLAVAASAGAAYATHSWGGYHWARTANPFTLQLGDDLNAAWDGYVGAAAADWNASSVLETAIVAGGTNAAKGRNTPKNCIPTPGRVEVCNAKYGSNGWLGLASIWASGDHITQGTVKLNDTYFSKPAYNTPAWRRMVACQEVAHTFGLDHQDEDFNNANLGTCMDYTSDPDGTLKGQASNTGPNAHDFEELELIYAHLDSVTTVSAASTASVGDTPSSWGREVRRSADGRSSVYELDLGRGNRVITHVLWAEPRR